MKNHIHEYWESQAKKYGSSHYASWTDSYVIDLEIQTIGQYIGDGHEVLDVGCANGYSTLHHVDKNIRRIVGVDFAESMIQEANNNRSRVQPDCETLFKVADARSLPFDSNSFDIVYTTRTLINLPTWKDQQIAMRECIRVCKQKGTIIFSEAFWEPLCCLNGLRAIAKLPFLAEHECNRFLKKSAVVEFLTSLHLMYDVIDFCSIYYLGTRFLQELITSQCHSEHPDIIGKTFYDLEQHYSGGEFGIQQAFVVSK